MSKECKARVSLPASVLRKRFVSHPRTRRYLHGTSVMVLIHAHNVSLLFQLCRSHMLPVLQA